MNTQHFRHREMCDGFAVDFDLCCPGIDFSGAISQDDFEKSKDVFLADYQEAIAEVDQLTNHADGIDYTIAVACGILTGAIDSVFVGELSLDRASNIGTDKVEKFVIKMAKMQGYKGDDLIGAVRYLEKKFPVVADKVYNDFGGGLQHHLRDFSHHPTLVGLFFSMLTQFTKKVYGTDVTGAFKVVEVSQKDYTLIGKTIPEKITFGLINWFFHMLSDVAGSSSSIADGKAGTGLPGPIGSLLKELSALPIFRKKNEKGYKKFSVWVSKLFNGTLLGKRNEKGDLVSPLQFDLRMEVGLTYEFRRQAVPVLINECMVRGFYFIRRFCIELQNCNIESFDDLNMINWANTAPFKNRTIVRMMTIASGTFTTIDMADAAIRTAIQSGGKWVQFILRVNFVGVGRFAIACSSEVMMALRKDRMELAVSTGAVAYAALETTQAVATVQQLEEKSQKRQDELRKSTKRLTSLKF